MDTIETSIYTAVLICCVVLGFVFLYFGVAIIRRQRKHYDIQKAHFLAEIEVLDGERNRIASDLHDELGPLLAITKIEINEIPSENDEGRQMKRKAIIHIDELTERLGGIARDLTPQRLLKKGLHTALEDFFQQYQAVTAIQLHYEYRVRQPLPVPLRMQVYRMIKEIVHNAGKHSGAATLKVLLHERKNFLYIHCKDDGIGIKAMNSLTHKNGIGLESLKRRVEMLGGRIHYYTEKGTEYFIEIPLTN